jgi:predicted nucleotidyltransferase
MDYLIYQLFGSKTRGALLTDLVMNQSGKFYVRELSRRLNIPHSMLLKEINTLEGLGILKVEKLGKMKLVSINDKLPYFNSLKEIIIRTSGINDLLREKLSNIKAIKYCLVFGSFANAEDTAESDLDVLVIGDIRTLSLSGVFADLEKAIGKEINYMVWSEKEFKRRIHLKSGLVSDIASKRVIMVIGDESGFRRDVEGRAGKEAKAER